MKTKHILSLSALLMSGMALAGDNHSEPVLANEIMTEEVQGGAPLVGGIIFKTFAASSMQNIYQGSDTFSYAGGGCIANSSASSAFFDESLNLPVGSKIVSVGAFYEDSNNGGVSMGLYNVDAQGSFNQDVLMNLPAVSGDGDIGEFLWLDTDPGLSNLLRFNINASPAANPCMIRVGYIPPEYADETVFSHKFEY